MEKLGGTSSGPKTVNVNEKPKHLSTGVSFMRVIDSDCTKQLQIPQEFVVSFNGNLPHRFIIETAAENKCWRVQVEPDVNGAIYIRDGWVDFVEANSLEVGDVLIFEHEEKSIFRVKIYGKNGYQKKILVDSMGGDHHKLKKRPRSEDDVECEALKHDEKTLGKQTIVESSQNSPGISKKPRVAFGKLKEKTAKVTNKGFSFAMHKRLRYQFDQMSIPMSISATKLRSKEEVVLKDNNGVCWPVKIVRRRNGHCLFSRGWKQFIQGNEVAGGDMLDFVFVSDDLIQVSVTKGLPLKDQCNEQKCQKEDMNGEDDELAMCISDDNEVSMTQNKVKCVSPTPQKCSGRATKVDNVSTDSFSVTIHETKKYQFRYLNIPTAIYRGWNLFSKVEVILQDADGVYWPVKVGKSSGRAYYFSQGWPQFLKGNKISGGDTLTFKLMSKNHIQVGVTKPVEVEHRHSGTEPQNEVTGPMIMDCEDDGPATCMEAHNKLKADTAPSRISPVLKASSFSYTCRKATRGYSLFFPKDIVARQKLKNKQILVLRDPEGKSWPLELRKQCDNRIASYKGWREFWKAHNIAVGDTVMFDFVSEKLIQVNIIRGKPPEPAAKDPLTKSVALDIEVTATDKIGDTVSPMYDAAQEESAGDKDAHCPNVLNELLDMDWEDDEPVCNTQYIEETESLESQERASDKSGNGYSITWRKTTFGSFLSIPDVVVTKQNLRNKVSVVLRDPEGKCWPIDLKHWWDGRVFFRKGWSEFWQGHNITLGDTLHFHFVSEYLVQVNITRGNSLEPSTEGAVNSAESGYEFHGNQKKTGYSLDLGIIGGEELTCMKELLCQK